MKLPLFTGYGGGNGFHNYADSPFEHDIDDIDHPEEIVIDNSEVDFTEYLWMENEEEFDKIEWQRLEEEELMKECIENMLEDEYDNDDLSDSEWADSLDVCPFMATLELNPAVIQNSTLNPLAKEFVPSMIAQ